MSKQSEKLIRRTSTIHSDDPESIRTEVVEALVDSISCELGMFVQCVQDDTGEYYFTQFSCRGEQTLVDFIDERAADKPAMDTPWLPPNLDPEVIDKFVRVDSFYDTNYLNSFEVVEKIFLPLEVGDQIRAVLYEDSTMLGWIGVLRRGLEEDFRRSELNLIQSAAPQIKSALSTAQSLEEKGYEDGLSGVLTPDGRLEFASPGFARWADGENGDYLRRRTRNADAGRGGLGVEVYAGAEVQITRLDATNQVRYLVTLDRPKLMRLCPEHWLTDRQQEVAREAASGATNREIAADLDISYETVKVHLKNIYDRLGIGSRTELAKMFADAADSRS